MTELSISVGVDKAAQVRAETVLLNAPKAMAKALPRAVNRALIAGRTAAAKEVTARFTVKSGDVRKAIKIVRATSRKPEGELSLTGENLPLRAFKHSPNVPDTTGSRRKPIRVSIAKGKSLTLTNAFLWNGHIFQRTGTFKSTSSNPIRHEVIKKRYGVSLAGMVGNVSEKVTEQMQNVLSERLDHETRVILEGKVK